jgi:DeoR family transcriptional regulator, fructose operon transcriptional repressor
MIPEKRRYNIVDYIKEKKTVTISEISNEFNISEITVRRDFDKLSQKGLIKKSYGGATIANDFLPEPVFLRRISENKDEKRRIAKEAVKRITDNSTVLLESGSTCLEIAKVLPQNKNIKIVATAPHIINVLCNLKRSKDSDGEILCCGGIWKKEPDIFIGPQAEDFFDSIKVDIAFFGIVALSLKDGWMVPNLFEAQLTKKITSCAGKIIAVTDHTKFDKISFSKIGPINLIDEIITDSGLDEEIYKKYTKAGVKITIC